MSVINTMLKDLEQRGGSDVAGDEILKGLSASSPGDHQDAKKVNYYLVSSLSVLVVVLATVIFYLISPYQLVVASKNGNNVIAGQPAKIAPQSNESSREIEIHALTETTDNAETEQLEPLPEVVAIADQPEIKTVNTALQTKPLQKTVQQKAVVVEAKLALAYEEDWESEQEISKTQREPTKQEKSQGAYLQALSMYNKGRVQESKGLLKDALNYDVYNLDARKLLASIYLREGRAGVAVAVIEKGLTNYSENQGLLRLYLQAQAQLENYAEAIKVMEQRLRLTTPEDIAYLAGLYQKNDGHLSAVKLYSQALQLKPGKSVWWMGQGISFEALSQKGEALKSYQQSIVSGQLSSQLVSYVRGRINTIEQMTLKSTS